MEDQDSSIDIDSTDDADAEELANLDELESDALDEDEEGMVLGGDGDILETLQVDVLPKQSDEFCCTSCFLVKHNSQRAQVEPPICRECTD